MERSTVGEGRVSDNEEEHDDIKEGKVSSGRAVSEQWEAVESSV